MYPEKTLIEEALFGLELTKLVSWPVKGQGCRLLPASFKKKKKHKKMPNFLSHHHGDFRR